MWAHTWGRESACDHSQLGLRTSWVDAVCWCLCGPTVPAPGPRPAPLRTLDCLSPPFTAGAPRPRPTAGFWLPSLRSSARHTAGTAEARWRSGCGSTDGSSDLYSCHVLWASAGRGQAGGGAGAAPKRARVFAELSGRVKPELRDFPALRGSGLHLHVQGLRVQPLIAEPRSHTPLSQENPTPQNGSDGILITNSIKTFKNGSHQKAESLKNVPVTF